MLRRIMAAVVEVNVEIRHARGRRRARGRVLNPRVRVDQRRAGGLSAGGRGCGAFALRVVALKLHPVIHARHAAVPPISERAERVALEHTNLEVGPIPIAQLAEEMT